MFTTKPFHCKLSTAKKDWQDGEEGCCGGLKWTFRLSWLTRWRKGKQIQSAHIKCSTNGGQEDLVASLEPSSSLPSSPTKNGGDLMKLQGSRKLPLGIGSTTASAMSTKTQETTQVMDAPRN